MGKFVDHHLFGVREDWSDSEYTFTTFTRSGFVPLWYARGTGSSCWNVECGGNPATSLLDLCSEYTGVDFSEVGLEGANEKLKCAPIPCKVRQADVCKLPFDDSQFDTVYSAHMLYHIPDFAAQRTALQEMLRVVRPGGVLVLITANPRPLLFPVRLLK